MIYRLFFNKRLVNQFEVENQLLIQFLMIDLKLKNWKRAKNEFSIVKLIARHKKGIYEILLKKHQFCDVIKEAFACSSEKSYVS